MKLFYLIVIQLLMVSCNSAYKDSPLKKTVNKINLFEAFKKRGEIKLSDFIEKLEYVPLETTKNVVIGKIRQLFVTEKFFVIHDWFRCYLFDRKGKFVRYIGKNGKGPGEYSAIRCIDVDEQSGYIYINVNTKRYFLKYNFKGVFLGAIGKDLDISGVAFIDTCNYIYNVENYYGNSKYKYVTQDINNEIIHKFPNCIRFNYQASNYGTVLSRNNCSFFVRNDFSIYAKPFFNDTIFKVINRNKIIPCYIFDCQKKRIPISLLGDNPDFFAENPKYLVPSDIVLNNKYVFVELEYQKKKYGGFYSVNTHKTYVLNPVIEKLYGFYNDFDGGLPFWPVTNYKQDKLAGFVYAYQLKDYIKNNLHNKEILNTTNQQKLIKMTNQINKDSNPILVIATIKKECSL
ncbi:MAG: 6-bladed beta-propeller [Bacteroidales bacterium]|nr:6-bladed beta-propeller [Bacteroidales bacterium]